MKILKVSAKSKSNKPITVLKRIVLIIIALFLVFALVMATTIGILKYQGAKSALPNLSIDDEYVEIIEYNGKKYKYNENIFSVAFLGIDQEELKDSDHANFVGASDAMIIVTVDIKTGKAKVIALPREIMVEMDTFYDGTDEIRLEETHQLYLAYSYGDGKELSCENALTAIRRVLHSVSIQKYYALNLNGIGALNDAIGGVVLKSKQDMSSYGVKKGDVITIKGDMAESYVRSRSLYEINGSLDRLDRQVQYIEAYVSQVLPAVMTDFSTIAKLYNVGNSYSQTNLSLSDLTYIASILISKGSVSFDTYTIDGEMTTYEDKEEDSLHAAFYPSEDSVMQTVLDVFYTRIG